MKVKDLVKVLKGLDQDQWIQLASDEEWNNLFYDIEVGQNGEYGAYVLFGLTGSEVESYEDIANNKYDHNLGLCINCGGERSQDQPDYCDDCLELKANDWDDDTIIKAVAEGKNIHELKIEKLKSGEIN